MTASVTPSSAPAPQTFGATAFTAKAERQVLKFIRRNDVLNPGERVVVAISGGPDSAALLVILARLRSELGIELTAAHFNHQLRDADEAAADLDFVRSLASAHEIPLVHAIGDVRRRARAEHESIEDAARRLRYGFLAEAATEAGAGAVVSGHTVDDQAETVLLHLVRGAGVDGLAGMRPRSAWPFGTGPAIARPLLALRRRDTETYCRELGLQPRQDPTNDLPVATRNRLRKEVIPALRRLNPNVDEAIRRFAAAAARDADYLEALARHQFARLASRGPAKVSFERAELRLAGPAIAVRLFRQAFAQVTGSRADLEHSHIESLLELLETPPGKLSLPGGVIAVTDSASLALRRAEARPAASISPTRLAVPGRTEIGDCVFQASLVPPPADVRAHPQEAFLDAESAGAELIVRSRRPGDRVRPLGLGGEKKVQDILVDAKVPAADRDAVPIVCAGDDIAWVVGHCIDGRYALTQATRQAVHLIAIKRAPGG